MSEHFKQFMKYIHEHPSPYIFNPENNNERFLNTKGKVNVTESEYAFNTDEITLSDLHLVTALADLKFATREILEDYLEYFARKSGTLNVPYGKKNSSEDTLTYRLKTLSRAGFIWKFTYESEINKKLVKKSYYCPSSNAFKIIKRVLDYREKYDELLSVQPIENVFGHLSVNSVANTFTTLPAFVELQSHESTYIKEKRAVYDLYQVVKFKTKAGDHKKIMIEPLRFNFSTSRITENNHETALKERLFLAEMFIRSYRPKHDPYIFFVCEDLQGIQKAIKLLEKNRFPFMNNIYLSTDEIIYKRRFKDTVLKLEDQDTWVIAQDLPFDY